jgi:hypothetical protein
MEVIVINICNAQTVTNLSDIILLFFDVSNDDFMILFIKILWYYTIILPYQDDLKN